MNMISARLRQAVQSVLNGVGAPFITVTRPSDGTTRSIQFSVQPYSPDSASQFQLEGSLNMATDVPYRLMGLGGVDIKEGDLLPINGHQYRVILVVAPPCDATSAYTHALAVRYLR